MTEDEIPLGHGSDDGSEPPLGRHPSTEGLGGPPLYGYSPENIWDAGYNSALLGRLQDTNPFRSGEVALISSGIFREQGEEGPDYAIVEGRLTPVLPDQLDEIRRQRDQLSRERLDELRGWADDLRLWAERLDEIVRNAEEERRQRGE